MSGLGGGWPGTLALLVAVAAGCAGVATAAAGAWRQGVGLVGGALLFGAVARLVLPDRRSGLLRVRRKALDVLWMTALGAGIVGLAAVVPPA